MVFERLDSHNIHKSFSTVLLRILYLCIVTQNCREMTCHKNKSEIKTSLDVGLVLMMKNTNRSEKNLGMSVMAKLCKN